MKRPCKLSLCVLFFTGLFAMTLPAICQGTRLWSQSRYDEFEKGTPHGVAVSSEGSLEPSAALKNIATTGASYTWSLVVGKQNEVYAGTGSPASVIQITPDGKQTRLFASKELAVQVVRIGPDGSIYAATLPSGKVYRLRPGQTDLDEAKAEVVFDPALTDGKPKYIWDMAFDTRGRLYIATGGPAAIYRVTLSAPGSKPEKFFSSDEQHIRCLLFEKDGSLVAGSDSGGLVYRISPQGKGYVIFNAPNAEITALAASPGGNLYIAAVGDKNKNNLPPLPVQGNVSVTATITIVQPGSIQASNNNGLIPEGSEVFELNREGAPRRLWAAHEDIIYALQSTPSGLIAATGNRGHLYRVAEDGTYLDIGHADASQLVALAPSSQGFYIGTSNSGHILALDQNPAAEHTFESMVFDTGFFSRFGRPEIDARSGSNYDLFMRAGNIENPLRGWSDWQKVTAASQPSLRSARFVQWKIIFHQETAHIDSVGIHYLPVNVAPVVDEIVVVPGARVNAQALQQPIPQQVSINFPSAQNNSFINLNPDGSSAPLSAFKDRTAVTLRWAAHDDNGDDLAYSVFFRAEEQQNWLPLQDRTREHYLTFDANHLPDGIYRIRIVASDAPSHNPGDALTSDRVSDRFTIDTTPPLISGMAAELDAGKVHVTLDARDQTSTIERAEYSIDAGRWMYLEPSGKLSDGKEEHYDFTAAIPKEHDTEEEADESGEAGSSVAKIPASREHVVTVRVYDRYGNIAAAKTSVR